MSGWPDDAQATTPFGVKVQDEGATVIEPATVLDFRGSGVAVTRDGQTARVTVSGGGGGGQVDSVVAGTGIAVDDTDPANPVVSALNGIRDAVIVLTDAQIKALPTTAIQLVAAPGAGFALLLMDAWLMLDATGGAYTNIDADEAEIAVRWDPSELASLAIANNSGDGLDNVSDFLDTNTKRASRLLGGGYKVSGTSPEDVYATRVDWVEDAALQLYAFNNLAGDFTGGNAANTLRVIVTYRVVPV